MRSRRIPTLYTDISGSGPTVVLLHGIFSSSRYWAKVRDLLDSEYKVVAIDLLGFGDSPKPRRNKYDYEDHINAINKTLDDLGIDEFTLIGHSMGALIALRYSIEHEKRVKQLVLTNMPIMIGAREVKREILGGKKLYKYGLSKWSHRVTWALFRTLHRLRWLPRKTKEKLVGNEFFFQHTATSRIRSFYNLIGEARVDADLARVRVKTTLLTGLLDRQVYLDNLSRRVVHSESVNHILVNTGHHIPRLKPEVISSNL